ncbi:hypothetical protein pipiens_012394 [Culex pipiens pipiens]|uniref:PiggyBac transposable element-derived protein domain-containing protein n=1 Tax=Culex pipiens pipiens TaxID=38569 RepID=A0ABD1D2J7_CULPP
MDSDFDSDCDDDEINSVVSLDEIRQVEDQFDLEDEFSESESEPEEVPEQVPAEVAEDVSDPAEDSENEPDFIAKSGSHMLSANYTPPPPKKRRSRSDSAGPPNKKQREEKQGLRVVLDATECIRDTGREVVVDNFFTSVELARKLKERNLFLTGTVRRCKPDIPRNMLPSKTREVHSTTFGYNDQMMMASYVPKKNKAVVFLTTNPELKGVDATSTKKKAYINLHYNAGKAAVDNLDKVTREFTVSRRTKRWPVKVFYDVLDVMIHNALVIFSLKNPEISNRKQSKVRFMQLLAYELAEANVKIRAERAERGGIHNELKNDFKIFFSEFARLHQPKAQPAVVNVRKEDRTGTVYSLRATLLPAPPRNINGVRMCEMPGGQCFNS